MNISLQGLRDQAASSRVKVKIKSERGLMGTGHSKSHTQRAESTLWPWGDAGRGLSCRMYNRKKNLDFIVQQFWNRGSYPGPMDESVNLILSRLESKEAQQTNSSSSFSLLYLFPMVVLECFSISTLKSVYLIIKRFHLDFICGLFTYRMT